MCGYVIKIKEILRACIRDFKLEPVMVLNIKDLRSCPEREQFLFFFFPVSIMTRVSMLEKHGEKCEGEGKRGH